MARKIASIQGMFRPCGQSYALRSPFRHEIANAKHVYFIVMYGANVVLVAESVAHYPSPSSRTMVKSRSIREIWSNQHKFPFGF